MLLHGLWDFSVFLLGLSAAGSGVELPETSGPAALLAPVVLVLPNFLYGWYLLRRAKRGELERQGAVAD
jgi:hypothetical protein